MFLKKKKRDVQKLNMTSTGDISFILLIFFLVITSMNTDKGLMRQLPPPDNSKEERLSDIKRENVMQIELTSQNTIIVNCAPLAKNNLKDEIKRFVTGVKDRDKHILMLSIAEDSQYDTYFFVQNEITAAYNELRDVYVRKTFGCELTECSASQLEQARKAYPQRISETYTSSREGGGE